MADPRGDSNQGNIIENEEGDAFYPFCNTRINNHTRATIVATYMSDGSTSSIALKTVSIRESLGVGNLSWVHAALVNMFGDNNIYSKDGVNSTGK